MGEIGSKRKEILAQCCVYMFVKCGTLFWKGQRLQEVISYVKVN